MPTAVTGNTHARPRSVRYSAPVEQTERIPGFKVAMLRGEAIGCALDPVIGVDLYSMAQPCFRPHPHAGMSAVTYMFRHSPGAFINPSHPADRSS